MEFPERIIDINGEVYEVGSTFHRYVDLVSRLAIYIGREADAYSYEPTEAHWTDDANDYWIHISIDNNKVVARVDPDAVMDAKTIHACIGVCHCTADKVKSVN